MTAKGKRATCVDVARRSGVSVATVSRVLADHPGVRADTRARVLRAVKELDYVPNRAARHLASGTNATVGVLLPDSTNPLYIEVAHEVVRRASEKECTALFGLADPDNGGDTEGVRRLALSQVGGILAMFSQSGPHLKQVRRWLRDCGIALVGVGGADVYFREGDCVLVDYGHAYRRMFEGVLADGARNVAAVLTSENLDWHVDDALAGIIRAQWAEVVEDLSIADARLDVVSQGGGTEATRRIVERLAAPDRRPVAFLSTDNLVVSSLVRAARHAKLRIPRDVVFAGDLHPRYAAYLGETDPWCMVWPIQEMVRIGMDRLSYLMVNGCTDQEMVTTLRPGVLRLSQLEQETT